jgi:uncharacterized protein (UPF0332 family)
MNQSGSKELIEYRINRAFETLKEIDILVDNQLWNTAVNRLYYACYYAVIALLLKNNILTQTHAGVRQMFGLHFIKTGLLRPDIGKFYSDIFDKRQTGDYDDFVVMKREDVIPLIPVAKELIISISKLLNA